MAERFDQLARELHIHPEDLMDLCRVDGSIRVEVESGRSRISPELESRVRRVVADHLRREQELFVRSDRCPAVFEYERPLTIRERAALRTVRPLGTLFATVGCLFVGVCLLVPVAVVAAAGLAALIGGHPQSWAQGAGWTAGGITILATLGFLISSHRDA